MIIFLVVLVVLIGICVGLYFFGKKAEKKQAEQNYLRQTVFEMRPQGQEKAKWKIHKDTLPQGQT